MINKFNPIEKEYIIMTQNEFNNIPISYLNQYYRDGWSIIKQDKENKVVIFVR